MGFHPDWIERQLAHDERNKVRAAYNHAQYLPERRRMMQQWADSRIAYGSNAAFNRRDKPASALGCGSNTGIFTRISEERESK